MYELYTKEFLIDEYWRFVREFGFHPELKDIKNTKGYPSSSPYVRFFGGWRGFLKYIGIKKDISREELKEYLFYLYQKYNKIPTVDMIRFEKDAPSIQYYRDEFGNFTNAIIECGFKDKEVKKQQLINQFKIYLDKYPNEEITQVNFEKHKEFPSYATYKEYFGSWNNFLKLMNIDLNHVNYTDDELLNFLRDYFEKYKKSPTTKDLDNNKEYPSSSVYNKRFGGLNKALLTLGLPITLKHNYSKEEIIDFIHNFYKDNNRSPNLNDLGRPNPSEKAIRRHFASLNDALRQLGYSTIRNKYYNENDKEYILKIIKQKCVELGRTITAKELKQYNLPNVKTLINFFGSWNNLLKLINQPINLHSSYTKEYLLKQLILIGKEYKCTPTLEFLKSPYPSYPAYVTAFGSWSNALRSAGFVPQEDIYTRDKLIKMLQSYANELGHTPSITDLIKNKNMPTHNTYISYFGSYIGACSEAGLVPNERGFYQTYLSLNGDLCLSKSEKIITDYFIKSNIHYEKEVYYKDFLENERSKRVIDWIVEVNNKFFYIEYFGLWEKNFYKKRAKKKIKDLYKAGLVDNCLFIFPWDLKNKSLDEIFSVLQPQMKEVS